MMTKIIRKENLKFKSSRFHLMDRPYILGRKKCLFHVIRRFNGNPQFEHLHQIEKKLNKTKKKDQTTHKINSINFHYNINPKNKPTTLIHLPQKIIYEAQMLHFP